MLFWIQSLCPRVVRSAEIWNIFIQHWGYRHSHVFQQYTVEELWKNCVTRSFTCGFIHKNNPDLVTQYQANTPPVFYCFNNIFPPRYEKFSRSVYIPLEDVWDAVGGAGLSVVLDRLPHHAHHHQLLHSPSRLRILKGQSATTERTKIIFVVILLHLLLAKKKYFHSSIHFLDIQTVLRFSLNWISNKMTPWH